jgi:putative transcriptional regulator
MSLDENQKTKLKELGAKVRALRMDRGLTLKELALSIDKDPQSVHRLEQGSINPSYIYLLQICEGLEVDMLELLKGLA